MEAACAVGLVKDLDTLRSFLYGRLWTSGVVGAVAAATVCARARTAPSATQLLRAVEAELDARIPSPAARRASRHQGGNVLRSAIALAGDPLLDALGRAALAHAQEPHYATAVGAVAAVAGVSPQEAAEAAAYASVAGPAFAAQKLLTISAEEVADLGVEMAPEVRRLAREAAQTSMRSLSQMPAFGAPALEYLAEEHVAHQKRSFAS
jgi:urease accessory protein